MSEPNTPKEEVSQYEPKPRGEVRISGLSPEAVDKRLAECVEFFQKHCDETDYRNLDWYLWRMQLRFGVGDDILEVVDDAFMAARCLHDRHTMHLELKPPEMFMTRRIVPVELGIISGMPMLTLEFSATYGLPLMMVLGQTAPEDIMGEANLMTSFFRRGFCADFVELTGLSAVIYAGVIAALGRGFEDEATLGLSTYARARDSLRGMPPAALLPKLRRYDALNTALACICAGNYEIIGEILAPAAEIFAADQARRASDAWLTPDKMPPPKYFDTAILTILALAAMREQAIELPQTGAIAAYREFVTALTQMPERRIEIPGLDEETRRILEQAGVDPDQLGVDHTYQDEKEASEARAAELFEERQRQAQEAVRAKIAQDMADEQSETHVEPQNSKREKLRLSEDDTDTAETVSTPGSYANFFAQDDEADDAARKANAEAAQNDDDASTPESETKDYKAFFASSDIQPETSVSEEETQTEHKDFSHFFSQESEEDNAIRARAEFDDTPEQESTDKGRNFSQFFTQNDEEDTSLRSQVELESESTEETGRSYDSFFDTLTEDAIPKFDDGSEDEKRETKTFSEKFFSDETKPLSGLKMELDEPEPVKPEPVPAPRQETGTTTEDESEDTTPRRDFTKLFDDSIPAPLTGLRMSLDDEENEARLKAAQNIKPEPERRIEPEAEQSLEEGPRRDFTKFFDESTPAPTSGLRMSLDDEENEARLRAAQNIKPERIVQEPGETDDAEPAEVETSRDFSRFFEQEDERRLTVEEDLDHEAAMRELELEQERKKAEKLESQKLKLALDGTEYEVKASESYQERMARLIAEKQAAAREMALREREEAERELEEMRQNGIARPVVEQLQLNPTESTDPDEKSDKVAPEDLVIKGFSYTDLDMIHENTAEKEELEEDFDMHAAMAQKQFEETQQTGDTHQKTIAEDEDIHIVIDYDALRGNPNTKDE